MSPDDCRGRTHALRHFARKAGAQACAPGQKQHYLTAGRQV
jgi:hypothetical protein